MNVGQDLHVAPAIGKGHRNVDELIGVVFQHALNDGRGVFCQRSHSVVVMLFRRAMQRLRLGLRGSCPKVIGGERRVDTQLSQAADPQPFKVFGWCEFGDQCIGQLVEHPGDVKLQSLPVQGVPAATVNHLALAVHDVVILQQTLADSKVVLLHLSLGALNGFGDHGMLDDFSILVPKAVHHFGDTLALEQAHQIVLQRDIELAAAWVPLAT